MSNSRLTTTGRKPSVNLNTLREILVRYFDEDQPSTATISKEFGLCHATTRKYLRLAVGPLPRGKAALNPRVPRAGIQTLLNAVPTVTLLGEGRLELLARRREDGVGVLALASEFEVSRSRVKALLLAGQS